MIFFETEEQGAALEKYVDRLRADRLDVTVVEKNEARSLSPVFPNSAVGAVYCSEDAQIDSQAFVKAMGSACQRSGVRIFENTAVLGTLRRHDDAVGVRTVRGEIHASGVVWATGAWAVNLAAGGVDLPIRTMRMGQLVTQAVPYRPGPILHGPRGVANCGALHDALAGDLSMFAPPTGLTRSTGYDDSIAQNTEGSVLIGNSLNGLGSLNPHISMAATQLMVAATLERSDGYAELGVTGLWAGLVGEAPDQLPIVDLVDGVFINAAHVHGVASGPASGQLIAGVIAGETHPLLAAVSATRPAP